MNKLHACINKHQLLTLHTIQEQLKIYKWSEMYKTLNNYITAGTASHAQKHQS